MSEKNGLELCNKDFDIKKERYTATAPEVFIIILLLLFDQACLLICRLPTKPKGPDVSVKRDQEESRQVTKVRFCAALT